ncbi:hypothetical protein DES49_1599 [Halospina denitrificans]|uniref:Uncharacterized protein n=1 Tax=Halospina denitrificans TaxID=332522 RepID=A0A4R7JUB4_9GAMM|nr:hypothetical protein [Halospina denitrificans]TDT41504.1 hypothetical protein DES49_1599 [Halospina denitrificans]
MSMRTDLKFQNGKLSANVESNNADAREALPPIDPGDRLGSDQWGEALKKQAGDLADDPALNTAARAHERLVKGFQSVAQQRDTQDPSVPQLQHLRQVETNFNSLVSMASKQTSAAREDVAKRVKDVKAEFEQGIGFNDKDASEIRGMLRNMDQDQRSEFIQQAVENGDGNVMAAVFRSHPSLSGLSQDAVNARYRQAMRKHAPKAEKLLDSLEQADSLLFDSFNDLLTKGDQLTAKEIREKKEQESQAAKQAADAVTADWTA